MNTSLQTKQISHIIIQTFLTVICIWDRYLNIPRYPRNFLYITQLDLYLHMIYFTIMLYIELIKKNKASHLHCETLFNFNFALSFLAFVMFWGMFFVDPQTLYKKGVSIPLGLNASLHGGVFVTSFVEQMFINKRINPSNYVNKLFYLGFVIIYTLLLKCVYLFWNITIYPFANRSNVMLIGVNIVAFGVTLIGHSIYVRLTRGKNKRKQKGTELKLTE